jgi:hypothetical protein
MGYLDRRKEGMQNRVARRRNERRQRTKGNLGERIINISSGGTAGFMRQ